MPQGSNPVWAQTNGSSCHQRPKDTQPPLILVPLTINPSCHDNSSYRASEGRHKDSPAEYGTCRVQHSAPLADLGSYGSRSELTRALASNTSLVHGRATAAQMTLFFNGEMTYFESSILSGSTIFFEHSGLSQAQAYEFLHQAGLSCPSNRKGKGQSRELRRGGIEFGQQRAVGRVQGRCLRLSAACPCSRKEAARAGYRDLNTAQQQCAYGCTPP